jgi:pantothenate kinase type III
MCGSSILHPSGTAEMSDHHTVLSIDIGNTNTHIGLVDTGKLSCVARYDLPSAAIAGPLPSILDTIRKNATGVPVVIGGGRQGRAQEIEVLVRRYGFSDISFLHYHERLPLKVSYDRPKTLGADRIADALYTVRVFPNKNTIIIGSGTAITINLITASAEFAGGAIMAGIPAQLFSLNASTDALPLLEIPTSEIPLLGRSTTAGIYAGTIHGIAGALNHLVSRYRSLAGGDCTVLATGGGWKVTEKLVEFDYTAVPDMTIIGTALYRPDLI